tara:strand:+ start:3426 stop:4763 length:1338 start_codon:yes stop_codon:yes gene_type:complete
MNQSSVRHVFVMGPDPVHASSLEAIAATDPSLRIHGLLSLDEVVHFDALQMDRILGHAEKELREHEESGERVDAVIAQWDFPTSLLVPRLCARRGLRSPALDSVVRCAHKYWSRVAQMESIPEYTPRYALVDPFAEDAHVIDLDFPFWLKPVVGFSSQLGFRIDSPNDMDDALAEIRAKIERLAAPFDELLERVGVSEDLRALSGRMCLAEEYLGGIELAHEGHVQNGEVHLHGTLEMIREDETFTRFIWPSEQPQGVFDRMADATTRFLKHIGFDDGCFNAEYFWDPETDRLSVIEFNPRMSQSHAPLAERTDGCSNHQIAVDVALGQTPRFQPGAGEHARSAKFLVRTKKDGRVLKTPTEEEMKALHDRFPSATISICCKEGEQLGELVDQDAYTYKVAEVFLGGASQEDMLATYAEVVKALPYEIEGVDLSEDTVGNRESAR